MPFYKMDIKDIIEFKGGNNHITILYKKDKKLFVFYCYTRGMKVDIEAAATWTTSIDKTIDFKTANIIIPINTYKTGVWYQMEVKNREEYELIDKVLWTLMEDKHD